MVSTLLVIVLLVACQGGPSRGQGPRGITATIEALRATERAQGGGEAGEGNGLLGTAQALAATAQAEINQAAIAAGDVAATAQAAQSTVVALATQSQPTVEALASQAAALASTVQAALTTITPPSVIGQADASAVVSQYALEVLGITVNIVRAGGLSNDIDRQINLSPDGEVAQSGTTQLALQTYAAFLQGGAASVSYGSGVVAGDITVDINSSSLGAFSFELGQKVPESEAEALTIVLQTFPGLSNRPFTPHEAVQGYAWLAEGQVAGFDVQTLQATLVAEKVLVGLIPAGLGRSTAYAVVGKGAFATNVAP
jgi:hypothetical protein